LHCSECWDIRPWDHAPKKEGGRGHRYGGAMKIHKTGRLALTVLVFASLSAASCGQEDKDAAPASGTANASGSGASAAPDYGSVTEQLSWFKNIEFSGEYAAIDDGFFKDAGFAEVELLAGGPTVAPSEVALASGDAWIGRTSPLLTAAANQEGGDNVIIAALYQKNPYTLTYLSSNPIKEPTDLIGQTVAVPDAAIAPWNIFLAANGIDPDAITRVPSTGGDAQEQLEGDVAAVLTYQSGTNLKAAGIDGYEDYRLDDHGVRIVGEALVVTRDTLENERPKVKAFLTAWIQGWNAVLGDGERAVSLAVDKYGKDAGLDVDSQTNAWRIQLETILTADTRANGVATITPKLVEENIASLNLAGFAITADDLFDLTIIDEIYAENPDLVYSGS
jgi:ABC-type nitrate/sulfonate/bicarbonate transport system substrate-binding protein